MDREPEKIVTQIDAALLAREEAEIAALRDQLGTPWYEFFLLAGLFCFAIGVAATIFFTVPDDHEPLYRFMVLWLLGMLIMTLLTMEYLVRRVRALRRFTEILLLRVRRLETGALKAPPSKDAK